MELALNSLLHAAAKEVLPPHYADLILEPGEGVQLCNQPQRGDYSSRWPRSVFYRLQRGGKGALEYTTTSELGCVRSWRFAHAGALAAALLEHLPERAGGSIADARAIDGGGIIITTCEFLAWQKAQGNLHCPDCGYFYAGERGLKDHQLMKHRKAFSDAQEVISQTRLQLMPYKPPTSFAPAVLAREQVEGAKQRAAGGKAELDEGLAAARDGDLARLRELLSAGWDARGACDHRGSNALLWAAGGGHLELCRFLVDECGLDAHWFQPKDHRNALHWAARNGHLDVCRWLVCEKGVDPDMPTVDGTVPLHWAVWQGHEAVCEFLVREAGADLHAVNGFGCNASQWSAMAGSVHMCSWLRGAGLDLKVLNHNGHSALHKASMKGQTEVCKWLLAEADFGAEQMCPDSDGNTPERLARHGGFSSLADWLQEQAELSGQLPLT